MRFTFIDSDTGMFKTVLDPRLTKPEVHPVIADPTHVTPLPEAHLPEREYLRLGEDPRPINHQPEAR